jgi:hypothetical protein
VTSDAVTSVASLVESKAIAIEFKAFSFLALAQYSFFTVLFVKIATFFNFGCSSSLYLSSPLLMPLFMKLPLIFRKLYLIFLRDFRVLNITLIIFRLFWVIVWARVVLIVLLWRFEDNGIINDTTHAFLVVIRHNWWVLFGRSLHIVHLIPCDETSSLSAWISFRREGQRRKGGGNGVLMLGRRPLYRGLWREMRFAWGCPHLWRYAEKVAFTIFTFSVHIILEWVLLKFKIIKIDKLLWQKLKNCAIYFSRYIIFTLTFSFISWCFPYFLLLF